MGGSLGNRVAEARDAVAGGSGHFLGLLAHRGGRLGGDVTDRLGGLPCLAESVGTGFLDLAEDVPGRFLGFFEGIGARFLRLVQRILASFFRLIPRFIPLAVFSDWRTKTCASHGNQLLLLGDPKNR